MTSKIGVRKAVFEKLRLIIFQCPEVVLRCTVIVNVGGGRQRNRNLVYPEAIFAKVVYFVSAILFFLRKTTTANFWRKSSLCVCKGALFGFAKRLFLKACEATVAGECYFRRRETFDKCYRVEKPQYPTTGYSYAPHSSGRGGNNFILRRVGDGSTPNP